MEIRYITPQEGADYQKISAASFIWNFNAQEDSTVEMPVMGAFEDDKLIAGVEVFDFRTQYCGNILNSVVLSGVCSQPECRRMGGVRRIFDKIAEIAQENDWVLGFLHPFSISYYEKFGYANLNRLFTIKVPFEKLTNIPHNADVVLYTGEQFDDLSELHKKCAFKENLMTLREDKKHFCDTPLESADYTYIHKDRNGKADGYARFKVKRPESLIVEELFVLTPEALLGLIGFLRSYDGIAKNLIVRKQYQGSPFACLTDRIDGVVYEHDAGAAARIFDVQKILENNTYPEKSGKFSLRCIDNIDKNNAIFDVEYHNGKASVKRRLDGDYDISVTATAAVKLLLAGEGHTAQTANFIDGVELRCDTDDFFRAFPYRFTRFMDSSWSE